MTELTDSLISLAEAVINLIISTCDLADCDSFFSENVKTATCTHTAAIAVTFFFVEPADAAAVVMRLEQQLSEELPQVDRLVGKITHHVCPGVLISC